MLNKSADEEDLILKNLRNLSSERKIEVKKKNTICDSQTRPQLKFLVKRMDKYIIVHTKYDNKYVNTVQCPLVPLNIKAETMLNRSLQENL